MTRPLTPYLVTLYERTERTAFATVPAHTVTHPVYGYGCATPEEAVESARAWCKRRAAETGRFHYAVFSVFCGVCRAQRKRCWCCDGRGAVEMPL